MDNNCVNVVYLEKDTIGVELWKQHLSDIFSRIGLPSCVYHVTDYDKEVRGKNSVFAKGVVDVFVTDVMLGHEEIPEGLTVAMEVKRDNPEVLVIAMSRSDITFTQASRKVPSFDLFIHKTRIRNDEYKDFLSSRIGTLFCRNVHAEIDTESSNLSREWQGKRRLNELNSILRTVTYTSHSVDDETSVASVVLSPLDGGRSGSEVYRMASFTSSRLECVSAVLKIDSRENSLSELENYRRYVKWYLPYTWRTELIGAAFTREHGALCYAFAHNPSSPFRSLTDHVAERNAIKIEAALDSIFKPTNQRWYASENQRKRNGLTAHYDKKWFDERPSSEGAFLLALRDYDTTAANDVGVLGRRYPKPNGFLLGTERDEYVECICHGDLHSGNVLITDDNDLVFIDFQATGKGHVFEDFVSFESGIRMFWDTERSFEECLSHEWDELVEPGSVDDSFFRLIRILREHAQANFPGEPFTNYVYALALQCFRSLRWRWMKDWQIRQQVACLLDCMRFLQEHEN